MYCKVSIGVSNYLNDLINYLFWFILNVPFDDYMAERNYQYHYLGVSIYFKAYSPPFGFSDFCKSLQIGSHIHQFLELEFSSKLENIQKIHEFVSIQWCESFEWWSTNESWMRSSSAFILTALKTFSGRFGRFLDVFNPKTFFRRFWHCASGLAACQVWKRLKNV